MSNSAIKAEGLGKRYNVGLRREQYQTLRDSIAAKSKAFVRLFLGGTGGGNPRDDEFWALRDVSFEIKHGETVGVIGRNGAGKSTLLKILSRITKPTRGMAHIYGRVGSLLEVGTGFHPELTGRENIYLNGAILGMRKAEITKKFDEIVAFSEIERFLETPVKRYSSGMYVRLAFAVSAHLEPEIMLVDEVLAVGDAEFQKKCVGKMEDVSREGRTVIFVSHNMSLISSFCRRAILLSSGTVEADGAVGSTIDQYLLATAERSVAELAEIGSNRYGNRYYGCLTRIALFNEDLRPAETFSMGGGMIVHVDISVKRPFAGALAGVKISSRYGSAIHYFVSTWEGLKLNLLPGNHRFEFRIPRLLLFPGTYLVTPWIARDGDWSDDRAEGALVMTMVGKDLTGHSPDFDGYALSGGEVYVPSTCRLVFSEDRESPKPADDRLPR
ncbi:MAG: ABC transporter ATP-binding protein [Pseudomonadota bacterium]